jgi:hypothetical protein
MRNNDMITRVIALKKMLWHKLPKLVDTRLQLDVILVSNNAQNHFA